jgi:hypothetical protein
VSPLAASPLPIPRYAAQLPPAGNARNLGADAEIARRNTETGATQAAFGDLKLLVVEDGTTISRDIVLNLSNNQMTLLPNDGGAPITAIPYRTVARATYVHARDPRWEPLLSGPATKVNVPGIFGRARHWLVVQTKNRYAILQLDADHWLNILQTFELRAGLQVDRPTAREASNVGADRKVMSAGGTAYAGRPK